MHTSDPSELSSEVQTYVGYMTVRQLADMQMSQYYNHYQGRRSRYGHYSVDLKY